VSRLIIFFFFVFVSADVLEEQLRYGPMYYDMKIEHLEKENKALKKKLKKFEEILKLHHKTLKYLLNKPHKQTIYITTKKTPLCLDSKCSKIKLYLPSGYIFKAQKNGGNLKITYYLYKNRFWHFVKRDRWIKSEDVKPYKINIQKECNTVAECRKLIN
jgi:hypothetical protein